jgi:anti-sigma factor RsiW
MSRCEECLARIDFYLDDELRDDDLEIFNAHLEECTSCRIQLEERRAFLEGIRSSRPLYVAPNALRDRIAQLLEEAPPAAPVDAPEARPRVEEIRPADPPARLRLGLRPVVAMAASVLVVAGTAVLWTLSERQARANAFVDTAILSHQREISGRLPMELQTNSEAQITQWFERKVPFHLRLPSYSGDQKQNDLYTLRGARLVAFKGDYAAYVCYRIGPQPISLLVTSASSAVASGGESTVSRGIAFHSHRKDGLQVVTWSVHGLTYALVSSVTVNGRQSCVICHANPKDKEFLRGVTTHPWGVANSALANTITPEK